MSAPSAQIAKAGVVTWTNGSANGSWDATSANWSGASTTYADGDAVQFNDGGPGGTVTIQNVTGSPVGVTPASVEFTTSGGSNGYTFMNGAGTNGIQGTGGVTLDAGFGGVVYLDNNNTYTGTTTINGGTLEITNAGNDSINGNGPVVLGGGTLNIQHSLTLSNNVSLTSGTTSAVTQSNGSNMTQTGTLSGGSNTVLNLNYGGDTWTIGNGSLATNFWSGFSGTVNVATGCFLRVSPGAVGDMEGSQTDVVNLGSGTSTGQATFQNSTGVALMGALTGGIDTSVTGAGHSGNNTNNYSEYVIGGAGQNTTFGGTIQQGSERTMLFVTGGGSINLTNGNNSYATKTGSAPAYVGAGTTILGNGQQPWDGVQNTFTGMPASNGGAILYVSNTSGSATGVSPVFVASATSATNNGNGIAGGTLAGDGIIKGEVSTIAGGQNEMANSGTVVGNFAGGAIFAPQAAGTNTSTTLSLTGGLTLGDWTNLNMTLDSTPAASDNSLIAVSNTTGGNGNQATAALILPGDNNIQVNFSFLNSGPELGVPYNLITYAGGDSYTGGTPASLAWSSTNVPLGDTVTYNDTGSAITATFNAVPEPGTLGLLALSSLGLVRRRRTAR